MDSADPTVATETQPAPATSAWSSRAAHATSVVAAGLVVGILVVVITLALAALVFSGDLEQFRPTAFGLSLASALVITTLISATSSAKGMVGTPQDTLAVIMAAILGAIASQLGGTGETLLATVITAMVVTSAIVGLGFMLLGVFRAGNLVRYVPYAVVGGFFAGTGWLLVKGGMEALLGTSNWGTTLSAIVDGERLAIWVPGVLLGILLVVVVRRAAHPLAMPGLVVAAAAVFHIMRVLTGTSTEEARESGLVLDVGSGSGPIWPTEIVATLGDADWGTVLGQIGALGTLLTVGALSLLLMASGVESILDQDVDLNAELRSAGWTNLGVSTVGGFGGFQLVTMTRLGVAAGARSRLVGVIAAAVCAVVLFAGPVILSLVPTFLLGALLLLAGGLFLLEWLVDAAPSMPRADLLVVLLIVAVVATNGFLAAFAVGLVAAVVLFVVRYSRIDVVTLRLSARDLPSRVERSAADRAVLHERGEEIAVIWLHGFLFFGTATSLLGRLRALFEDSHAHRVRYVVVELRRVTGMDPSAVGAIEKAGKVAEEHDAALVLASVAPSVRHLVEVRGLLDRTHIRLASDLDHGIEWCEEQILADVSQPASGSEDQLWARLAELLPSGGLSVLRRHLQAEEYSQGTLVMRQGESARELYFLATGELTSNLALGGERMLRLRSYRPGTVVGDMAFLLGSPRSASVVAERDSRVYRLDHRAMAELQVSTPDVAAGLYRYLAELLAERLELSNRYGRAATD